MAAPRVFISSTYYDLKHVRNDIGDFIRSLGYTPVMHDRGGVAYTQTDTIENSCYSELTTCDIVICIIGNHFGTQCGATSFLRNSDKIYEKKRNASQAPGRRFWPSAAARTRTRSWRPLWTRWWPPGSLIVRSVGWRWTTRPTPCDCYCSKWGGM